MNNPIFTIGHATRSIEEFVDILKSNGVDLLVDVRSVPRSLKNPQYNESVLPQSLKENGIDYIRLPDLGGFRAKSKTIPPETNEFWQHNSFHSYADYAMTEQFQNALTHLITLAANQTPAIMCAELLWWRCHRRIITDYLLLNNQNVIHILHKAKTTPANLTPNAQATNENILTYPIK